MAATIEKVDETLSIAGFENRIPLNRAAFAGGDGNSVEDAPIGYYRFHFWRTDEQWKEHENWISNTDVAGPICVSLLREEQALGKRTFYRMLFRSLFGNKSVVLCKDDVSSHFFDAKKLSKHQILGIGLQEFINHERDKMAALEDEFGAMSIRTTCSVTSASNDLVRSLPNSRLREASSATSDMASFADGGLSRKGSISRMGSADEGSCGNAAAVGAGMIRKRFRELCGVNAMELVKSFTQVKEKDFYHVLLTLEKALDPQVCHIDVVISAGSRATDKQRADSWQSFSKLLGQKLTKEAFQEQSLFLAKQGRVPSDLMSELILEQRKQQQQQSLAVHRDKVVPATQESNTLRTRRHNLIADFAMNEVNYLRKLQIIDEYFLGPMDPQGSRPDPHGVRGLMHMEDFRFVFEGFAEIMALHRKILAELFPGEEASVKVADGDDLDDDGPAGTDGSGSGPPPPAPAPAASVSAPELPSRSQVMARITSGQISGRTVGELLVDLCKAKEFTIYANICDDFYERSRIIKRLSETNAPFREYIEMVAHDPRSNRLVIDQVMGNIFQMITRYALQLKSIIEATPAGDESVASLEEALLKLDDTLAYIEHFKKRRDDTTNLFGIQRSIANCPPNLCQLRRIFLTKMAAYQVERGEVDFSRRLTLFLFNDIVLGARKQRGKEGKFDRSRAHRGSLHQTHEFLFLAPIDAATQVRRLDVTAKARKRQAKAFSLDISLDSLVWQGDRQRPLRDCLEEDATGPPKGPPSLLPSAKSAATRFPTSWLLVPKKQEKLTSFLETFNRTKHQAFLASSPADIYVRQTQGEGRADEPPQTAQQDLYFHVIPERDYYGWAHKNRIALLYSDHTALPSLLTLFPEAECDVLMIVQVLNGSFRFHIKSREMIVAASDCIEPTREFHPPEALLRRFTVALTNCHLLYSIYPPFGPQVELQMRQQLERHIEPFTRGVFRRFKELAYRLHKTNDTVSSSNGNSWDDGASSIYSVENNSIVSEAAEDKESGKKKHSVLGKVLGKLRSPLAKFSTE